MSLFSFDFILFEFIGLCVIHVTLVDVVIYKCLLIISFSGAFTRNISEMLGNNIIMDFFCAFLIVISC